MTVSRLHTGDRMSQVVIHGDTVYLAGQVAQEAPGGTVTEQTKAILAQIDGLLAEAGTDKSKSAMAGGPAVILVEPQLGENIGFAARAMLNCGMTDLRLVRPRDGWPNEKADAASAGAVSR